MPMLRCMAPKTGGRNNFRFFAEDMNVHALERLSLENSLRFALERNEMFFVYQPQMDDGHGKNHRIGGLASLAASGIRSCAARQVHTNCREQRTDRANW